MITMQEIRENPSRITPEFIAQLKDPVSAKRTAFKEVCDAYDKELEARRKNLRKQAAVLHTQVKRLSAERDGLARQVTETTSRGDLDKAAVLDAKLEQIEGKIRTTQRKIRLADESKVKGDPDKLDQVRNAMAELGAACGKQVSEINELRQICEKQIDFFERLLSKELKYAEESVRYEADRLDKIEDVFNDGPARRAAAEAERLAKYKADKHKPKSEVYVIA